jgi:serine/threonine-protein kinase
MLICPECGCSYLRGVKFCAECGIALHSLDLDLGTTVGSYRLIELLGEGGMGRVYVAEHLKLGRRVAIKKLRQELLSNTTAVARLFAEARAVNRISHDHIVEITDLIEQPGGDNYIVMELLHGEDLAQRLRRKQVLPLARALDIAAQTANALAAVHAAGMVHRDLKPENIFLIERGGSPDFVKVLDFGIAKLGESRERGAAPAQITAAGQILGTPEYMSPEQAAGRSIDARTDIYALGVIVYEMVTGVLPFQARSFGDLLLQHMTAPVELPSLAPGLSPSVRAGRDQLILDLLAKQPSERPQSMTEVELQIRALLDALGPLAVPVRPSAPALPTRDESAEPRPAERPSNRAPSGAGTVARVALVKRQTPQAAVEIASPRSVSRIDVVTPARALTPPPVPLAAEPSTSSSVRLARASSECEVLSPEPEAVPGTGPRSAADPAPSAPGPAPSPESALERSTERSSGGVRLALLDPTSESPHPAAGRGDRAAPIGRVAEWARPAHAATGALGAVTSMSIGTPIPRSAIELGADPPDGGPAARQLDEHGRSPRGQAIARPRSVRSRRTAWLVGGLCALVAAAAMAFALDQDSEGALPVAPREVRIKFVSAPPGATVRIAGSPEPLGITPFSGSFPRSERSVTFELTLPGFIAIAQDMTLANDDALAAALTPMPAAASELPSALPGAPPPAPPPGAPDKSDRRRTVPIKRAAPPLRPIDRNGTLDVFKRP